MSKRIQCIQSLVSKDNKLIYDLCCDHGQIAWPFHYFAEVIYVDIVPAIVKRLKKKVSDIPFVEVLQEDCTHLKMKNKYKTIILAGIGGDLSIKILNNLIPQMLHSDEIIISAHKNIDKLRAFLHKSNLGLLEEWIIEDNGQFYEIFKMSLSSHRNITLFGDLQFQNKNKTDQINFLKKQISFYKIKSEFNSSFVTQLNKYQNIYNNLMI